VRRICVMCGRKFRPVTRQVYCSDRCAALGRGVAHDADMPAGTDPRWAQWRRALRGVMAHGATYTFAELRSLALARLRWRSEEMLRCVLASDDADREFQWKEGRWR